MRHGVMRPNQRLHPNFNRFFMDNFFTPNVDDRQAINERKATAFANIAKMEDGFLIEMAVPGFSKEEIKISLDEDRLTISGNKTVEEREFVKREFSFNDFERAFSLPKTVDMNNIEATVVNGILSIKLNKLAEKPQLHIEVK